MTPQGITLYTVARLLERLKAETPQDEAERIDSIKALEFMWGIGSPSDRALTLFQEGGKR